MPFAALVSAALGLYRNLDRPPAPLAEYCDYTTGQLSPPLPLDALPAPSPHTIRVVCISDTHLAHHKYVLPKGDLLVHAGDIGWLAKYTGSHSAEHFAGFVRWLRAQAFPHAVFVAGNHDLRCEAMGAEAIRGMLDTPKTSIHYLEDEELCLEVRGARLRIFGSPRCVKPDPAA
eukprot:EG_transcript_36407